MLTAPQFSADGLRSVLARIERSVRESGRAPGAVRLVAVSKRQPVAAVQSLAEAGQRDFGENYLQEALPKLEALGERGLCWHFIGQVQGNKTREVAERFDWVHTVDRARIAARLSAQRPHYAPPLEVLLQVKLSEEPTKGGVSPQDLPALAAAVADLPRLRLRGLMCIPPETADFAAQRVPFRRMRELLEALNSDGHRLDTLSMGMSADLEAAILEGATMVRVGTAVFGPRQ